MGLLVDGVWQDAWYDTAQTGGRFVRQESQFRNCEGFRMSARARRF